MTPPQQGPRGLAQALSPAFTAMPDVNVLSRPCCTPVYVIERIGMLNSYMPLGLDLVFCYRG